MGTIIVPPGDLDKAIKRSTQVEDSEGLGEANLGGNLVDNRADGFRYQHNINIQSDISRPSLAHHRAIFLPTDEQKAEVIWLQVTGSSTKTLKSPVIDPSRGFPMDSDTHDYLFTVIGKNQKSRSLLIFICPRGVGVSINQSVIALAPGRMFPFMDPYIVVAATLSDGLSVSQAGEGDSAITIIDTEMDDFHQVVHFFRNHFLNPTVLDPTRFGKPCIPALRISDILDRVNRNLRVIETIEPVMVSLQSHEATAPLAFPHRFGLRWYIRTIAQPQNISFQAWNNIDARWFDFVIKVNKKADQLGNVEESLEYVSRTVASSVLIMQADGTPIDIHHLYAFNDFMDLSLPSGLAVKPRSSTVPTKSRFQHYWAKYAKLHRKKHVADPWEFDSMIPEKAKDNILDSGVDSSLAMSAYLDKDFWNRIVGNPKKGIYSG